MESAAKHPKSPSGKSIRAPYVAGRQQLLTPEMVPLRTFRTVLRDNQNHARCDNQASLTPVNVVQRELHPGIMMSGRQAGVKPGPLGPRLWRLRA